MRDFQIVIVSESESVNNVSNDVSQTSYRGFAPRHPNPQAPWAISSITPNENSYHPADRRRLDAAVAAKATDDN